MLRGLPDGPARANVRGSSPADRGEPSGEQQFICHESTGNGVCHQAQEKKREKVGRPRVTDGRTQSIITIKLSY